MFFHAEMLAGPVIRALTYDLGDFASIPRLTVTPQQVTFPLCASVSQLYKGNNSTAMLPRGVVRLKAGTCFELYVGDRVLLPMSLLSSGESAQQQSD